MSAPATVEAPTRPTGWPARSESRVALTGTIGGLAERLGAPADFLRLLALAAAYAQPWIIVGYLAAAVALAAPGERGPGWGSLAVAGKVAALIGLFYLTGFLPGSTTALDLDGEPASWIPFSAIGVAATAALLIRPCASRPAPRDAVLGAAPFVLAAAGFALAVVLFPEVRWERWLFVPTVVAGVVLVARPRGRLARAAIAPAATLAGVSALLIGAGVRLEGGAGDITLRPRTAAGLPRELRRGVGNVELDLSRLRGVPRAIALDASVGVGTIDVTIPPRTVVEVDARLGHGRLNLNNLDRNERDGRIIGRGVPVDARGRPLRPRTRLRLRLRAGIGEVTVNDDVVTANEDGISTRWKL